MSRGKVRAASEICADCCTPDPKWASVNRGVLICDECCSVHRSLGRHISSIKSLKKGSWSPTLLSMVHQLASHGANNIWEHTLLDPALNKHGKRKPNPRDNLYPTKADFIRAKYQFLSFVKRHRDGENMSIEDLNKELHSCVRTNKLETTMRLLALGANPNYFHLEKNNYPLHVAAQAGQTAQVEMLVVYGADPGSFDSMGKTPIDYASAEGHGDLSDRLVECQFELTDRLAFYLCGRKPDHRSGQHFVIPEMADSSLDLSELAKAAKKKLQALPNHLFEELAMDVYDEVDRRENETIWLSTQNHTTLVSDRQTVPFLPVNPEFSSTRNQGRQKLARFNAREFATLIIDILKDARKRQQGITSPTQPSKDKDVVKIASLEAHLSLRNNVNFNKTNSYSDDEPNYDSVASDDDYSSIDSRSIRESLEVAIANSKKEKKDKIREQHQQKPNESMASEPSESPITIEEYLDVKRNLQSSESRMQQLIQTNKDLRQEIHHLKNMVQQLMQENSVLRADKYQAQVKVVEENQRSLLPNGPANEQPVNDRQDDLTEESSIKTTTEDGNVIQQNNVSEIRKRHGNRPQSMYEPRNQHNLPWKKSYTPFRDDIAIRTGSSSLKSLPLSEDEGESPSRGDNGNSDTSEYENDSRRESKNLGDGDKFMSPTSPEDKTSSAATCMLASEEDLPSRQEVIKKTEKITKKIQELLQSAQVGNHESYVPCSDKIHSAVAEMAELFPKKPKTEALKSSLYELTHGADRLKLQCATEPMRTEESDQLDYRPKTQLVIQCAYDIAKAAKRLVTLFETQQ